jgi:hypothetical protein
LPFGFTFGGVSWTKFEHCISKIRRILMTDARAERAVIRNPIVRAEYLPTPTLRASRAPSGRVYKTKNFLTNPFSAGGVGGAAKKMKGNFMVLLRRFRLQNKHLYYSICGLFALFISPSSRRDEALPLRV